MIIRFESVARTNNERHCFGKKGGSRLKVRACVKVSGFVGRDRGWNELTRLVRNGSSPLLMDLVRGKMLCGEIKRLDWRSSMQDIVNSTVATSSNREDAGMPRGD